jgi:hypothetical protein
VTCLLKAGIAETEKAVARERLCNSRSVTEAEYGVGMRYQAARSEDIEELVRAMVSCKECELAIGL